MLNIHKVLVVHSPHAGRSSQLAQALDSLRDHSIEVVETLSIAELDGLPIQGPQWQTRGVDLVVAAGGDGLIGGVITHLAECGLPLAILPLGTSNDIARSLTIPQNIASAAALLTNGQFINVDIGVAYPAEQTPHPASSHPQHLATHTERHGFFAHALTAGLNVEFARLATNVTTRKRYGRMTYPFVTLEVLRNHTALEMELHFTGLAIYSPTDSTQPPIQREQPAVLRCRALQATVINAPIFGGAWQLSIPGATLNDGLLDIIVVEDIDLPNLNTMLTRLFSHSEQLPDAPRTWHERYPDLHPAELTGIPGIHHIRAKGVTITTSADPQDVTLDGEVRGQTPVSAQMASEQLCVVVPKASGT